MAENELLPNALVLFSKQDRSLVDGIDEMRHLPVTTQEVDFRRLEASLPALRDLTRKRGLDFLLFAQNDQVLDKGDIGPTIRELRAGYSSFSGIDDPMYLAQTRQCIDDLVAGQASLDLPAAMPIQPSELPEGKLGFCLVFDTEQMGGVRFGLPRILGLLDAYRVPSTFFVTGFVATRYPELLPALRERGHSVGIHGRYHEYLSALDLPAQVRRLQDEKELFAQHLGARGANLIFRMNRDTVEALATSGFDYFVVSMEYTYAPFGYHKMPVGPFLVWTPRGTIWMVPISVETYNRPLMATKLALDSAIDRARRQHAPVVNLLMHPFRDGTLRHLGALESLIQHLHGRRRLGPTTLDRVIQHLPKTSPTAYVYVHVADGDMNGHMDPPWRGVTGRHWGSHARYWQRVQALYSGLEQLGYAPALCVSQPEDGPTFAIYPCVPPELSDDISVDVDPLVCAPASGGLMSILDRYASGKADKTVVFRPSSQRSSLQALTAWSVPEGPADWLGVFPELGVRVASRLRKHISIFSIARRVVGKSTS
jgi:peptidoglycan/xylan/chitin deacetylase (PgdA/CDA1 family)